MGKTTTENVYKALGTCTLFCVWSQSPVYVFYSIILFFREKQKEKKEEKCFCEK